MQALRAPLPGRQRPVSPPAARHAVRPAAPPRPVLQARLAIGSPGDAYEQEADRVAGEVMGGPAAAAPAPCSCGGGCPRCAAPARAPGPPAVSRVATPLPGPGPGDADLADADLAEVVAEGTGGGGAPLDREVRAFMEPRFGRDLGHVRVHADAGAARSARRIDAVAYTAGRDIVFGAGRYAPHSPEGRRLIAHELTHTIQQGAAGAPAIGRSVAPQVRGGAAGLLQRVGECASKSYRNCGGSCVPPGGGTGFCRWSGTVKNGCICIPAQQPVLRPELGLAALTAYGLYKIYQAASTLTPAAGLAGGGTMAIPASTAGAAGGGTAAATGGAGTAATGGAGTAAAGAAGGEATALTGLAGGGAGAVAAGALPVIAMAGVFVALGAGYAEARTAVRNESTASGFSQGFVMGLLGWEWHQAVDRFGVWSATPTPWDEALGTIKANAHNRGLKAGFEAGSRLPPDQKAAYLREIRRLAGPRDGTGWSRRDQIDYVIELAAVARQHVLKPE